MNIETIVMKLIGEVRPVGEEGEDCRRLNNIKELTLLVDNLMFRINEASNFADRHEYSMKVIGIHAGDFIKELKES